MQTLPATILQMFTKQKTVCSTYLISVLGPDLRQASRHRPPRAYPTRFSSAMLYFAMTALFNDILVIY